jgi:hypothetical protein
MSPVTLPVLTIDDLMRSLQITEDEILDDLLYPLDHRAVKSGRADPAHRANR